MCTYFLKARECVYRLLFLSNTILYTRVFSLKQSLPSSERFTAHPSTMSRSEENVYHVFLFFFPSPHRAHIDHLASRSCSRRSVRIITSSSRIFYLRNRSPIPSAPAISRTFGYKSFSLYDVRLLICTDTYIYSLRGRALSRVSLIDEKIYFARSRGRGNRILAACDRGGISGDFRVLPNVTFSK